MPPADIKPAMSEKEFLQFPDYTTTLSCVTLVTSAVDRLKVSFGINSKPYDLFE